MGRSGALCERSASQVSPSPSLGLAAGVAASCAELSSSFAPRLRVPCVSAAKIGVVLAAPEGLEVMPTAAGASPA